MPRPKTAKFQERLALRTYVRLMRAANSARSVAARHLGNTDLTLTQFAVLEAIYHLGPMSLSDIAKKILTTGGNLTMVVGNLEKRGLAQRRCSPEDRRVFILGLTAKGKTLMRNAFPKHREAIREFFAVLEPEEQEQLAKLCRKLGIQELAD